MYMIDSMFDYETISLILLKQRLFWEKIYLYLKKFY